MRSFIVVSALALMIGCGGEGDDSPSPTVTPTAPVTYARVWNEVLLPSCAFSSCHGAAQGTGGLKLTEEGSVEAMVNQPSTGLSSETLVVPGDADNSYLIKKLRGESGLAGDPMPPPAGLDAERLALVEAWIHAGALAE